MSYVENRSGKEITDREIQLKVLKNLQDLRDSNNTIKDWITFFWNYANIRCYHSIIIMGT